MVIQFKRTKRYKWNEMSTSRRAPRHSSWSLTTKPPMPAAKTVFRSSRMTRPLAAPGTLQEPRAAPLEASQARQVLSQAEDTSSDPRTARPVMMRSWPWGRSASVKRIPVI